MATKPEHIPVSELDRVMTERDRMRERVIQAEIQNANDALADGRTYQAQMHWCEVRSLIADRRREVVEAMERQKGLR